MTIKFLVKIQVAKVVFFFCSAKRFTFLGADFYSLSQCMFIVYDDIFTTFVVSRWLGNAR